MSERKVLNKYYPPDFDASKIPKLKLPRDRQYVVRLMAPFNMRCTTCGEYIYKGKKFNARKETVQNETYLGLMIFRFYIRCPRCISEITFKTDPENTDYVCEKGASRNFQAHKLMEEQEERLQKEREEEELNNPMKALENRTKESKQEMDILEKLEELKDLNARQANVDYTSLIGMTTKYAEELKAKEEQDDEDLVKSIFGPKQLQNRLSDDESGEEDVDTGSEAKPARRKATDVLTEGAEEPPEKKQKSSWNQSVGKLSNKSPLASLVKVKKTREHGGETTTNPTNQTSNSQSKQTTLVTIPRNSIVSENSKACAQPENDSKKTDSAQGLGSLSMLGSYSSSGSDDSD